MIGWIVTKIGILEVESEFRDRDFEKWFQDENFKSK